MSSSPVMWRQVLILAAVVDLLLLVGCGWADRILVGSNRRLVDDAGRERFFHGVNAVYKSRPYIPRTDQFDPQRSLVDQDFSLLRDLGINAIRLGVMWPGIEPTRGVYNETYLQVALNIVNRAVSYGIHSIVDFHQDVLSEKYCGEGVPLWAADTSTDFPMPLQAEAFPVDANGVPSPDDCGKHFWPYYQFTYAAAAGYQALYDNVDGRADAFAKYWGRVAALYKGNDAVIGVELFNEPFAGDVFRFPMLLFPGAATRANLEPLYDLAAGSIRAADPSRVIMFSTTTWADTVAKPLGGSAFSRVPGGNDHVGTSVLAFHYYDPPNVGDMGDYFQWQMETAQSLQTPAFVTEVGLNPMMAPVADLMDRHLLSWAAWDFKEFGGADAGGTCTGCDSGVMMANGTIIVENVRALSRTYAQAVAGSTIVNQFNSADSSFVLQYIASPDIQAPTLVYVASKWHYPKGYQITVMPSSAHYQMRPFDILELSVNASAGGTFVHLQIHAS
ncbi:Glycoside hydrolase family 5 domain-containing protein [Plasmodiophora brassicae]